MMNKPLFDEQSEFLLLDEYVYEVPSFRKIMEDGVITDTEVQEQSEKVVNLLKKLEGLLSFEARELLTESLCEMAVLYAISRKSV